MVPDAKMLHPYMGFSGHHGYPTFQTESNPGYSQNFCALFQRGDHVFSHNVKMFFPEIKHGVISVDEVKYSIEASEHDDVTVTSKVVFGGKYEEYAVINDFTAEFEIEITVNFGARWSITEPVEIFCDFIDVYVHNQRISLTVHDNNLLFVPYAMSYKTGFPPEVARLDSKSMNIVSNTDVSYGFILNTASKNKMEAKGFDCAKLDGTFLDTKKLVMNVTDKEVSNSESFGLPIGGLADAYSGVTDKHILLLPQAIFPDRMTLSGIPIFNSEVNMKCCGYRNLGWCTPYFEIYDVNAHPECKPSACVDGVCIDTPQYEVRNKVIDGYLILADKSWDELDALSRTEDTKKRARDLAKQNTVVEEE